MWSTKIIKLLSGRRLAPVPTLFAKYNIAKYSSKKMKEGKCYSGKEFNELIGKKENLVKVLNRNLKHNGYIYVPDSLNILGPDERFMPSVNCDPGGLYFGSDKYISDFVTMVQEVRKPLIAKVRIPNDATVCVGISKYKTNALYLEKPMEINDYITDEYIVNRDDDTLSDLVSHCCRVEDLDLLKRIVYLAFKRINKRNYHDMMLISGIASNFELLDMLALNGVFNRQNNKDFVCKMASLGNLDVLKWFVQKKYTANYDQALYTACYYNHAKVAIYIMENCVDIADILEISLTNPLSEVLDNSNLVLAQYLCEKGLTIQNPNYDLMNAVKNDRFEVLEFLLDRDVRPNPSASPLFSLAIHKTDMKFLKILLDFGITPDEDILKSAKSLDNDSYKIIMNHMKF